MKTKVTVIMPTLNVAPFIEDSLNSVQNQSLQEIEILCVDSGSTDGTIEIINRHAAFDHRIKIISAGQKSYGYQVNLGIDAATGEYIGIVEADDYIDNTMYEDLYRETIDNHPDYIRANIYRQLTFNGVARRTKAERIMPDTYYNRLIFVPDEPSAMLYANYFNIWDGIYRKDFLNVKNIRLHESPGASYQDAGFAVLCSIEAKHVMFLKNAYYCYRMDNENSSVKSEEKYKCTLDEFRWIKEQMQERGKINEIYQTLYMYFLFDACYWNLTRLTRHYRTKFLEELPKESIYDFDENIMGYNFPYKDIVLKGCRGDSETLHQIDTHKSEVKKGMHSLQMILKDKKMLVFVTAARIWGNTINTFPLVDPEAIWTVCDNSENKQGKPYYNQTILSIQDAVKKYPSACFALPEASYTQDLEKQLISLGIKQEQFDYTLCKLIAPAFNIDILTNRLHVEKEDTTL